ncbi:MAG: type II toxin-antitoxin system VapC family toxin [Pleurocapsa minor HA4230-MV1]|nr:type II toxin-antitoxin system VapC family toxin [Pleurocapsa minor HA4230-MV1]
MIVADTNLIAYLFIEGEFTLQAESIYQFDPDWVAPYLWRSEFRNILTLYLRKKILSLAESRAIADLAEDLLLNNEFELNSDAILDLAFFSSLSAYDCEYVVLAQKLGIKLITNDKKILRLFPDLTINLATFEKREN